jgi:HD superfamily phosphodiesterase
MLFDKSFLDYTAPEPPKLDPELFNYSKSLDPVEKIKQRKDLTLIKKIEMVKDHLVNECGITDELFAEYLSYYSFKENKVIKKWLKRTDKKYKKKIAKL